MLYSVGKDSAVMLHLARKAFYPSPPPFPLLHVDTRWKFQQMYDFRDQMAKASGMPLIVHINPEGVAQDINPFDHGSAVHTDIMKTQGLRQALDQHGFDVAFGGARRDEEKAAPRSGSFRFVRRAIAGIQKISVLSCGTYTTVTSVQMRASAYFHYRVGPSWTFGNTSAVRTSPLCRCTLPRSGGSRARWSATDGGR